jgi:hypothetical protein
MTKDNEQWLMDLYVCFPSAEKALAFAQQITEIGAASLYHERTVWFHTVTYDQGREIGRRIARIPGCTLILTKVKRTIPGSPMLSPQEVIQLLQQHPPHLTTPSPLTSP